MSPATGMEEDRVCSAKENQVGDKDLRQEPQNSFPFLFSRVSELLSKWNLTNPYHAVV